MESLKDLDVVSFLQVQSSKEIGKKDCSEKEKEEEEKDLKMVFIPFKIQERKNLQESLGPLIRMKKGSSTEDKESFRLNPFGCLEILFK